jgi:hypothetical protein
MAESVSRGVRVQIRSAANPEEEQARLLQRTLGIDPHSIQITHTADSLDLLSVPMNIPNIEAYDSAKGKKYSSKFFSKTFSNCSPWTVVACLGFARIIHSVGRLTEVEEILERERSPSFFKYAEEEMGKVTMAQFARQFAPQAEPLDVQIGLYVQSLCHYNSRMRRNGLPSLQNARKVVQDIARNERTRIYQSKVREALKAFKANNAKMARELRRAMKLQELIAFMDLHQGVPRLFTHGEVAEMNLSRPPHDQIELTPSMLPKHHCAFPDCPMFLKNLSSQRDRAFDRRNGLFKHIKYFFLSEPREHVRGLHIQATHYLNTSSYPKLTREDFIASVFSKIERQVPPSRAATVKQWIAFIWDEAHRGKK